FEALPRVAKSARLARAAGRRVLRVEENEERVTTLVARAVRFAVLVRPEDVGRARAGGEQPRAAIRSPRRGAREREREQGEWDREGSETREREHGGRVARGASRCQAGPARRARGSL